MQIKKYLFACLTLACSAMLTAQPVAKVQTTAPSVKRQVMFVITSDDGVITRQNGDYLLTMKLNNLKQMLLYTTRPNRLVKYVRRKGIQQAWQGKEKSRSFAEDAPNAVLMSPAFRPVVVTLMQMHLSHAGIRFLMHPIKPGMFHIPTGHVSQIGLTIDAMSGGAIAGAAVGGAAGAAIVAGGGVLIAKHVKSVAKAAKVAAYKAQLESKYGNGSSSEVAEDASSDATEINPADYSTEIAYTQALAEAKGVKTLSFSDFRAAQKAYQEAKPAKNTASDSSDSDVEATAEESAEEASSDTAEVSGQAAGLAASDATNTTFGAEWVKQIVNGKVTYKPNALSDTVNNRMDTINEEGEEDDADLSDDDEDADSTTGDSIASEMSSSETDAAANSAEGSAAAASTAGEMAGEAAELL